MVECFVLNFESKLTHSYNHETAEVKSDNSVNYKPISIQEIADVLENKNTANENDIVM